MKDKIRVLKMIEEGKLNSEEAIKVLNALENSEQNNEVLSTNKDSLKCKILYVLVESKEDTVKINIPIEFLKIASKCLKDFKYIEKYNIDLDEIMSAVDNGFEGRIVDIESKNNEKVIVEIR